MVDQTQWYAWAALPCNSYIELRAAYGLYILELGQAVLVTQVAWADLCAGWGKQSALQRFDWGLSMNPVANGLSRCQ
jgi:hypothetical protein